MGAIVAIRWDCFTISTEVGIMTNRAFVTVPSDIGLMSLALAKRTITENAMMFLAMAQTWGDGLIDWDKAMSWVNLACSLNAG